ncbi:hypothetical protein [Pseudoalteromonas marina]|uniref:hypothetical protein n=1 Tax=Pseudoalteromonas marina TaxID=267375 RepID=UPI0023F1CD64|nr:hypothetical protein [Pseudoalteromonas marina]
MTNQPLSVVDAINTLVTAYNQEVAEFDQLVTDADQLQEQNDKLTTLVKDYEQGAAVLLKNLENAKIKLAQANRERDQALTKNQDTNITLSAFKEIGGTPKKLRDKIKSYKERLESQRLAAEQQKRQYQSERKITAQLKTEISELENRLDVAAINQIYRNDNDIIQTYPYHLGGMVEGHDEQQTPLLYLNQSGRGGLILLNKDDEAELVEAPKGGLRPKKETLEHCGRWLRRAKANGWQTDVKDIKALANSSD